MSVTPSTAGVVAAQLLHREQLLRDPVVRKDRAAVAALLAEDFVEIGASGRFWTRDEILDLLATEEYHTPVIEGFACQQIAEDVVLVNYRAVRTHEATGKRSVTLRTSLWSKENGVWRMRFHQGTPAL